MAESPPAPKTPPQAATKEDPATKAAADAAAATEKTLNRKRRGRQSLILESPTGPAIGSAGASRPATNLFGGGSVS